MTEVSPADSLTRTTVTSYDAAGRVLAVDGPSPGTDDKLFNRYDAAGRKTWEIGGLAPNGLRIAPMPPTGSTSIRRRAAHHSPTTRTAI